MELAIDNSTKTHRQHMHIRTLPRYNCNLQILLASVIEKKEMAGLEVKKRNNSTRGTIIIALPSIFGVNIYFWQYYHKYGKYNYEFDWIVFLKGKTRAWCIRIWPQVSPKLVSMSFSLCLFVCPFFLSLFFSYENYH